MYKLINLETKQEYLCKKVVVDRYDYYIENEKKYHIGVSYTIENGILVKYTYNLENNDKSFKKIITTNNPTINIPQIVDEVEEIANKVKEKHSIDAIYWSNKDWYFKQGYNKAKEQTPYSKQDMIEFAECLFKWQKNALGEWKHENSNKIIKTTSELLELFENNRPKTIYFK